MEPALYLCLIFGIFMLSLSARQSFSSDEHRLGLSEIPMRIRQALRCNVQGYWVRRVRVTMQDGKPAYWFTGSTPTDPDMALLVLDSGEAVILPPGTSTVLEDEDAALPAPSGRWIMPQGAQARLLTASGHSLENDFTPHGMIR